MSIKDCQYIFTVHEYKGLCMKRAKSTARLTTSGIKKKGSTPLKKNMTYLWCQTTHQGNQLPWELRYSIKPVWIRIWEQQTPFKSFHISRQRRPWTSRHFDGICRTDVKKTTNARSRDSSPHQSPKTRSEVNGPDKDNGYHIEEGKWRHEEKDVWEK